MTRRRSTRRRSGGGRPRRGGDGAPVAVIGVPFDANSSFLRGAAGAPAAIRAAMGSPAGNPFGERGVRVWPSERVRDLGDLPVRRGRAGARAPLLAIERGIAEALAGGRRLLVLGGDHAITYPVVRAFASGRGPARPPISLLQFDAHPDLYPELDGNRYSHACPMARLLEEGLVDRLVQVGIRTFTPAQAEAARRHRVEVYPPSRVGPALRLRFRTPLYVTVDLDGLDPAFAPGVSHREPGGLTVRQVLDTIAQVRAPLLAGADVVELNPRRDPSGVTAAVAAKLARELLARMIVETGG